VGVKVSYIKNREKLLSHGKVRIRQAALDIIDYALEKADPYIATKNLVSLKNNNLHVGSLTFNLHNHKRIFVLGAGKATFPIVKALEEVLGNRITDGVIICKYGQEGSLKYSKLHFANHPIPDEAGYIAAQEAMTLAKKTRPGDIVFAGITGGSSALMTLPVPEISLEEKKVVNKLLLTCGANIIEINAVRKHLSQIKGGRLAKNIHPEAHLINLTVSDVIGDPLDYITCPTVPDTSTFKDAQNAISKYKLWEKLPTSVRNYLKNATSEMETPKDLSDHQLHNFIIVAGDTACVAAEAKAKEMGFNTMILSTMFEGESKELGRTFVAIAKEIVMNKRPLTTPCAIISGGETTIKLDGDYGIGGPNQEFALSAALYLGDLKDVVIVGVDTDGTDGPTKIAGAIADSNSTCMAKKLGISLQHELDWHNTVEVFEKMGDAIITGPTGTNVNDLKFLLVL